MAFNVFGKMFLVFCFLLMAVSTHAAPFIIDDSTNGANTYWGGAVQHGSASYGDIIGPVNQFGVDGMTITKVGDVFTVKVTGAYFSGTEINNGWGPGDLYISSQGYSVSGTDAHHVYDTFTSNEGWDYVVTSTGIYALSFNNIKMTTVAPLNPSGYIYRTPQAWREGTTGNALGNASVDLDSTGMTFTFNMANIELGNTIGLHWTMKCGNDVVEGGVPVPEPATLLLLGLGLAGVAGIGRKVQKK